MSSISVCHNRITNDPIVVHASRNFCRTRLYTKYGITWAKLLNCLPIKLPWDWMRYSGRRSGSFILAWLIAASCIWNLSTCPSSTSRCIVWPQKYLTTLMSTVCKISVGVSSWTLRLTEIQKHCFYRKGSYSVPGILSKGFMWSSAEWPSSQLLSSVSRCSCTSASDRTCCLDLSFYFSFQPGTVKKAIMSFVVESDVLVSLTLFFTLLSPLGCSTQSSCSRISLIVSAGWRCSSHCRIILENVL